MRTFLLFALLSLLTGCQTAPQKNEDSPLYAPPTGSLLRLLAPLHIKADKTSVIIQNGEPVYSYWNVNTYYPHCDFELHTLATSERVIQPDVFTITRVVRDYEYVMLAPVVVAGIGTSGAPPLENFMTIMYLQSDKQPDVMRITCQHWGDPSLDDHLTINEIHKALGKLFKLELVARQD